MMEEQIAKAEHTGELRLAGTACEALPGALLERRPALAELVLLDLSDCGLTECPPAVTSFVELEEVLLGGNLFTALPGFSAFESLTVLDLSRNRLEAVPALPTGLEILDLSSNHIRELPDALGDLVALRELKASRNAIEELPTTVNRMAALQRLDLSRNQLLRLPSQLGTTASLVVLDLAENELTKLPLSLRHLEFLQELDVANNPLIEPPAKVCAKGVGQIRAWLAGEAEKLYDARNNPHADANGVDTAWDDRRDSRAEGSVSRAQMKAFAPYDGRDSVGAGRAPTSQQPVGIKPENLEDEVARLRLEIESERARRGAAEAKLARAERGTADTTATDSPVVDECIAFALAQDIAVLGQSTEAWDHLALSVVELATALWGRAQPSAVQRPEPTRARRVLIEAGVTAENATEDTIIAAARTLATTNPIAVPETLRKNSIV